MTTLINTPAKFSDVTSIVRSPIPEDITASATVDVNSQDIMRIDTTSNAVDLTLPSATTATGVHLLFKFVAGSLEAKISPFGAETIDGQLEFIFEEINDYLWIVSNGLTWDIYSDSSSNTAGANTQIQFNNNGEFGANANFVFDGTAMAIGTSTPDVNAVLDLTSTTQGFLPPRMTTTERDLISSPAQGLQIYNLTTNESEFYNGTAWFVTSGDENLAEVLVHGNETGGSDIAINNNDSLSFNSGDFTITHDSFDVNFIKATGDILFQLNSASNIEFSLGSTDQNSSFSVIDSSSGSVLEALGDGRISIGDPTPEASAQLQVQSASRGFLMPRMTTTQRDAISLPATGLEIYNTEANEFQYFNGTEWRAVGLTADTNHIVGGVSGIGANQTNVSSYGASAAIAPPVVEDGEVLGLSIALTAALTAGTCEAQVTINGVAQTGVGETLTLTFGGIDQSAFIIFDTPIQYVSGDQVGHQTVTVGASSAGIDATLVVRIGDI